MLFPYFERLEDVWPNVPFHDSVWITPILGSIHLLALVAFSAAILVVDLRLLGRGLRGTTLASLSGTAEPWLIGSFLVLVASGGLQVMATPLKVYYSPFFWWKMQAVAIGIVLTCTVRRRLANQPDDVLDPVWRRIVGLTSLALWTSAMIGARWIGLMG